MHLSRLALAATVLLATAASAAPIKIGIINSLTGPEAPNLRGPQQRLQARHRGPQEAEETWR